MIRAVRNGNTKTVVDLLDRVPIYTKDDNGESLLHWAARGGHVTTMRLLIRRGCDVDSVDGRGLTPLHWAAALGQTKAVRELIGNGATKTVVAGEYGTPLHLATLSGHVETVEAMLAEGCPIDVVDSNGKTFLHWAAYGGHVEVIKVLVGRGCDVNAVDIDGCTPLYSAASFGRTEAVRELIRLGAPISVVAGNCGTPLDQAALKGHVKTVVAMLAEGCPIDAVNSDGATVLHFAAQGGFVEVVMVLVVRGCDVNAVKANGCTPLHDAAGCGKTEAVRELITLGATKSVVAGNCGTPLHQAALKGHVKTAEAMLAEGCPIDIVDSNGATVLHFAAAGGHIKVMMVLVDRGCDVNAVEVDGCTPLHFAASCGRTEAVCELIKLGATKSVVAGDFGAPLHEAALRGHVETVQAMLAEGCPVDIVDSNGATVLHFAAAGGHIKVMMVLVDRGCDVNAAKANGCTPLHSAAACGRIEAVHELIKLGATKSVIAGNYGTPLHQAALSGHVETVEVLLEADTDLSTINVAPSEVQTDCSLISICDSVGETPVMYAVQGGQVEVFKVLISKGGSITDRDTHSVSTLEQCFVGGHASKLSQFCEACDIGSSGEGLRGALATLITKGLVDAHKVLCLCAISGDSVFLEEHFIELVASDECLMPAAVRCAKHYFHRGEGVSFIDQLGLLDGDSLSPLHISLLSLKCFRMDFADYSIQKGANDHTSFITKLLSHPVLKGTVNEHYPNGLSPLDLAKQFELHDIAALIEGAGGRPRVWANVPQEIEAKQPLALARLKENFLPMVAIAREGEHGPDFLKEVFSSVLHEPLRDRPSLLSAEQLGKKNILRQKPKSSKLCHLIIPHVSSQNWKLVGLLLLEDISDGEATLNAFSHQFSDDRNRFLETLSYWLEHGCSVTWKTLLDVLGHFETKHTIDELTDKIVSELGGAHQVSVQCCVLSEGAVWCAGWRRQVLLSCHVCLCLCCLLLLLSDGSCEWSLQTCLQFCSSCEWRSSCYREESTRL